MAGTGSTGIVASYMGRHSVLVELEEKFVDWIRKNVELLEKHKAKKGEVKVIQGDARKLTELLGVNANTIITSPPYSEANRGGGIAVKGYEGKYGKDEELHLRHDRPLSDNPENVSNLPHGDLDAVITSPPYSESMSKRRKGHSIYSELEKTREMPQDTKDDNIANLIHGDVDAIITSPPYSESLNVKANEEGEARRLREKMLPEKRYITPHSVSRIDRKYSANPENVGNLPHGDVDAIVTSPPYSSSVSDNKEGPLAGGNEEKYGRWKKGTAKKHSYTQHGEPCKVDAIITSPPYSDSRKTTKISEKDLERKIKILEKGAEEGVYHSGGKSYRTSGRLRWLRGWMGEGFSENKQNISNLPHGDVDAIITSPPYSEALSVKAGGGSLKNAEGEGLVSDGKPQAQGAPKPYSADLNEAQIGNLRHGDIDAIVTSPPYSNAISKQGGKEKVEKIGVSCKTVREYSSNPENIGNLQYGETEDGK